MATECRKRSFSRKLAAIEGDLLVLVLILGLCTACFVVGRDTAPKDQVIEKVEVYVYEEDELLMKYEVLDNVEND